MHPRFILVRFSVSHECLSMNAPFWDVYSENQQLDWETYVLDEYSLAIDRLAFFIFEYCADSACMFNKCDANIGWFLQCDHGCILSVQDCKWWESHPCEGWMSTAIWKKILMHVKFMSDLLLNHNIKMVFLAHLWLHATLENHFNMMILTVSFLACIIENHMKNSTICDLVWVNWSIFLLSWIHFLEVEWASRSWSFDFFSFSFIFWKFWCPGFSKGKMCVLNELFWKKN